MTLKTGSGRLKISVSPSWAVNSVSLEVMICLELEEDNCSVQVLYVSLTESFFLHNVIW